MSNRQTVAWKQVRAARPPNEEAVAAHVARFRQEARAWQLREIREAQGLTQQEVAQRMDITQPTVSALESGELDRSGLATLKAYVKALGGTVEVAAKFGDRTLLLSGSE